MQNNTFTGRVAKAPSITGSDTRAVCRFTLMENEYAGKDKESGEARERTVALPFTAFGPRAQAIAKNALKGDQLIVSYRVENNVYEKDGETVYGYNFVVEDFSFGAPGKEKREQLNQSAQ